MLGPIEFVAIEFPGNQFKGEIIPALRDIINKGLVRIIDLVFIRKDANGSVQVKELKDLDPGLAGNFDPMLSDIMGLVSEADIQKIAGELDNNSSTGILVIEHLWAKQFKEAVIRANGKVVEDLHIPREAVDAAEAALKTPVRP
jgi:uncharacterized membrane protein